jgi:hypothetical protein
VIGDQQPFVKGRVVRRSLSDFSSDERLIPRFYGLVLKSGPLQSQNLYHVGLRFELRSLLLVLLALELQYHILLIYASIVEYGPATRTTARRTTTLRGILGLYGY